MTDDPQSPKQDAAPTPSTGSGQGGLGAFWAELKRRKVVRVAITYAVVAWLIIQIAATTFPTLMIPEWALRLVTMCIILGFPVAIILAWAFELTPDGIKTAKVAQRKRGEVPVSAKQQRKRNLYMVIFAAAVPTVIFGTLALFFYLRSPSSPDPTASSFELVESDKSIAVLPLENMSPDPDNAFFAKGVHEDIIGNLSNIGELHVIGRQSTLGYANTTKKLREIGGELNVRYLVQGSVRRANDRVLVSVQLVDSNSEGQLWSERYDKSLDDIFAIQATVAKEIARNLNALISPIEIERIDRRPTQNQKAYDAYVKARESIQGGLGPAAATPYLEEAVATDPTFAEAWALLAIECIFPWDNNFNRDHDELLAKAHYSLEQAKKWGANLPEVPYAENAFALRESRDVERSIDLLLQALNLNPQFELARMHLGIRYLILGRIRDAETQFEMVLRNNPLFGQVNLMLVDTYQLSRNWDRAYAAIQSNLRRAGSNEGFWRGSLLVTKFLQDGDRNKFLTALNSSKEYQKVIGTSDIRLMSVLNKDFDDSLRRLEELNARSRITALPRSHWISGLYFDPNVVKALIHFERDDLEFSKSACKKAAKILRPQFESNSLAHPWLASNLAISYALDGDRTRMGSAIEKARELAGSGFWRFRQQAAVELHIAIAYLVLGDHDRAIETLEAASEMDGPIFLNRELDLWFIFDRLRGNPRFDALLKD